MDGRVLHKVMMGGDSLFFSDGFQRYVASAMRVIATKNAKILTPFYLFGFQIPISYLDL